MKIAFALAALLGVASAADCNPNNMFTGATEGPWFEASNWALNRIPAQYDNVEVSGKTVVVDNVGVNVVVHDVVIDAGGLIVIEAGNRFDIDSSAGCAPASTAAPVTTVPTVAGATTVPTVAGATTVPTVAGATTAPAGSTVAGATTAPTVAGATTAPAGSTVAGATTVPTVAGATTVPTVAGATTVPTVAGATTVPTVAGSTSAGTTAVAGSTAAGTTATAAATTATAAATTATAAGTTATAAGTTAVAASTAAGTTAAGTTAISFTKPPVASNPETCTASVVYSLDGNVLSKIAFTQKAIQAFASQGIAVEVVSATDPTPTSITVVFKITQAANHATVEDTFDLIVTQLTALKAFFGDFVTEMVIDAEDNTCKTPPVDAPSARVSARVAAVVALFGAAGAAL